MGFSKSNMAGWGPKFKDHPKMAFVPVIYHIGPYENAWKNEKLEFPNGLVFFLWLMSSQNWGKIIFVWVEILIGGNRFEI